MNTNPSADRIPACLSWTAIQNTPAADPAAHPVHSQKLDLNCPEDVFEQLFPDHSDDGRSSFHTTVGD